MRTVAVLLALATVLAGCSDGGDPGDAGATGTGAKAGGHGAHGGHDPATHIVAPNWTVGLHWTLSSPQLDAPFTHVVAGDAGADWVVDTDEAGVAFFDAQSDISFLGKVRKSDLAGSQGSDRVEFFQFPLTQGKSWTTQWDGEQVTLNVTQVKDGRATIESRFNNGTLHARYTYDAALGYFRDYAFYAPDGASVGFEAKVTANGRDFPGDLLRWGLTPLFEHHGGFEPMLQNFDIDPEFTDLWLDVAVDCASGAIAVNVGALTGIQQERGYSANGPCPAQVGGTFTLAAPQQTEAWGASIQGGPVAQGTLDVTLLGRTQVLFKAGEAPAS